MTQYKYFIQEGSKFHLKSKFSTALLRSAICLGIAAALYFFLPPERKIGAVGAGFFAVFAVINLLKSTKKLTIDTAAKTIIHQNSALNPAVTYRFDEFVQFYVLTSSYLFKAITLDSTAFLIFDQNGREKRVPVVVGLFSAKPAQKAVNEISHIMGIELA